MTDVELVVLKALATSMTVEAVVLLPNFSAELLKRVPVLVDEVQRLRTLVAALVVEP